MGGMGVHLGGVGIVEAEDVAGELDDHALHAEAYAECGHVVLAAPAECDELSVDAALAEAGSDDNAVEVAEALVDICVGELLGVYVDEVELVAGICRGVEKGLADRLIGILELDVLADESDCDGVGGGVHAVDEVEPLVHVRLTLAGRSGLAENNFVEMLGVHHQGHFVD